MNDTGGQYHMVTWRNVFERLNVAAMLNIVDAAQSLAVDREAWYQMAKTDTTAARSPRGTKPVAQAFFSALEVIPEASRAAVSKAALAMIRDQIKLQREKAKLLAVKAKAASAKKTAISTEEPVAFKAAKAKPTKPKTAPAKRRSRKTADMPAAAE